MLKNYIKLIVVLVFATNVMAQNIPSYMPKEGLVGYWPFNGNANDESGNGNHGTVNGATLSSDRSGNVNSAYSFDGLDDFISTSYSGILGGAARSVSFWAKQSLKNISSNSQIILGWGSNVCGPSGIAKGFYCAYNIGANATVNGISFDANESSITYKTQSPVEDNNWHHYVFVKETNLISTDKIKIYQDGILLTESINSYLAYGTVNTTTETKLTFGKRTFSCVKDRFYNGSTDEVAIYNRALSEQEVKQLYSAPTCSITATIINQGDLKICQGGALDLKANTAANYTYQWFNDNQIITGATSSNYKVTKGGKYSVKVSNQSCSNMSSFAIVDTIALPDAPSGLVTNIIDCEGYGLLNTIIEKNNIKPNYRWYRSETGTDSISKNNYLDAWQPITYFLSQISNTNPACESVKRTKITVEVIRTLKINYPSQTNLCQGDLLKLDVFLEGNANEFIWMRNNNMIPNTDGKTSITVNESGNYYIAHKKCLTNSFYPYITINFTPKPDVKITYTGSTNIPTGGSINLSVSSKEGNTYEWFKNGTLITGTNTNIFSAKEAGKYSVKVTNNSCSAESLPLEITTNNASIPLITFTGNKTFCTGDSIILKTDANNGAFEWLKDGKIISGVTNTYLIVKQSGSYSVKNTLNNVSQTSDTLNIKVNETPIIYIKDTTLCDFGSVKLNAKASVGTINWYNTITGGAKLTSGETYTTPTLYNTTTFYVDATNGQCTSQRIPVKVNVNYYRIDWSDTVVCIGNTTKLTISNNTTNTVNSNQIDALIKSGNWTLKSNYNNHYYLQYKERKNWEDAKKLCEANGGYIFCVNDKLENDNVAVKIANSETYGDFLIGLYQDVNDVNYSEPSGGWKWVDGSPLNYTNWASTKTNWVADEPSGGGENYALIDWSNMGEYWNDVEGHISGTVIMEYSGTTEYLWSTGETTQSINPTITKPTNFWVDITTNGVTCRKYISINVYPTLKGDLTLGNNNQTKCVNQPIENIEYTFNKLYYYPISLGTVSQMPAMINPYVKGNNLYINGTPTTSGTYNYSISVKGKCETTDVKGVLVINSLPNASIYTNGPSEVCEGKSVNLIAKGGVNYKWSNGLITDNITVKESGKFDVTVSDANGCVANASQVVTIFPNPIVSMNDLSPLLLKSNAPIKLYGKPTGGTFTGQGVNGAEFSPSMTTLGKKVISYNYTSPQGCIGSMSTSTIIVDSVKSVCSTYDTITVKKIIYDTITVKNMITDTVNILKINFKLTTGIYAAQMSSMSIFPNPTSEDLHIKVSDAKALEGYRYRILDALGKEVYNELVKMEITKIPLKNLGAAGIYHFEVIDQKNTSIQSNKIVLQ